MFVSDAWLGSAYSKRPEAEKIATIVFDDGFNKNGEELTAVTEPLVRVLRVITCIDKMTPDPELRDKVLDELEIYKSAEGRLFSSQLAIDRRGKQQPDLCNMKFVRRGK
ncbi:hypothetical protein SUGI_1191930 [Cryptomeria japonica]|nr:hypothetical protein SUGI_1191930 [Cryptomeria japonica]